MRRIIVMGRQRDEHDLSCFCGSSMDLVAGRLRPFYRCARWPFCSGRIDAHEDGKPCGIPGDKPTREARRRAHAAFDRLWKDYKMSRAAAYRWLSATLGVAEAHIGMLDERQCDDLVARVEKIVGKGKDHEDSQSRSSEGDGQHGDGGA